MEIFNVGPLEFLLILILAFVILGPQDMVTYSRRLGRWVYRFLRSPLWLYLTGSARELQELPRQMLREAALEDSLKEIRSIRQVPAVRWEDLTIYPELVEQEKGAVSDTAPDQER